MKKILGYLKEKKPERVTGFMEGAKAFFAWAKANFDELSFYTGQNYDMENLMVISYYKNHDDDAPTFLYLMDGLKSYKVWFVCFYFFKTFVSLFLAQYDKSSIVFWIDKISMID